MQESDKELEKGDSKALAKQKLFNSIINGSFLSIKKCQDIYNKGLFRTTSANFNNLEWC
jgi:hypothetical protein